jgi:DNA-directed RNA polymerase specialized sigma subunit
LNNRIVEYSKSIIDRNAKLRSEIMATVDAAPSSMKNQLNQVLKDFQIAGINPIENPNIAKQLIRAKDDWNEQFPGFEELNKTEQRVFVLTMENYRPKEIANVLGVSTQYVRNVKSRLKTKLNLKEDWGN